MGKIIFILGGTRSGKSSFATSLARDRYRVNVAFIATCQGLDEEMKERIHHHRRSRPKYWRTFEYPVNISQAIRKHGRIYELLIIDCLTLLVSNMLLKNMGEGKIALEMKAALSEAVKAKGDTVMVSNEVGLSIVPQNKLARDFRDVAGRVNQIVAKRADEVYFMVAGIPWRIK